GRAMHVWRRGTDGPPGDRATRVTVRGTRDRGRGRPTTVGATAQGAAVHVPDRLEPPGRRGGRGATAGPAAEIRSPTQPLVAHGAGGRRQRRDPGVARRGSGVAAARASPGNPPSPLRRGPPTGRRRSGEVGCGR